MSEGTAARILSGCATIGTSGLIFTVKRLALEFFDPVDQARFEMAGKLAHSDGPPASSRVEALP